MRRGIVGLGVGLLWLTGAALVALTFSATRAPDLWAGVDRLARCGAVILLVVAAALAFNHRRRASATAVAAALSWQGSLLAGSGEATPLQRSAGLFASAFTLAALGLFAGLRRTRWLWAIPAAAGVVWAASYDPFRDPRCTTFCATNQLLLHWSPRAATSAFDVQQLSVMALSGAAVVLAWRVRHRTQVVLGIAIAAAAFSAWLRAHDGYDDAATAIGSVAALTLAATAVVPVHAANRRLVRLVRLRRLARATAAGRGRSLQHGLRVALADPTLRVAYPVEDGTLVDASGSAQTIDSDHATTTLAVDRHTVAIIVHDPAIDEDDLRKAFGPASRMAAWNEGLAANLRHQLAEVTASRRRLIDAGDRERRRLERDLHDGIQQGLLGLLFDLRRAERAATGDERVALSKSVELVSQALVSTRSLANGVFPAIVDRTGLASVLNTLVEHGERPVEIDAPEVRLPAQIARTVHDTVAAAVGCITQRPATVFAHLEGQTLRLQVTAPGAAPPPAIEDRIAALGGTCHATAELWTVELPCGS